MYIVNTFMPMLDWKRGKGHVEKKLFTRISLPDQKHLRTDFGILLSVNGELFF